MTLLKQLATSIVLGVFLFVFFYFAICIAGGAVTGAMAGSGTSNPQEAMAAGRQAGQNFVRHNILAILLGSFLLSAVSSLAVSFSGLLPWCRKPKELSEPLAF